MSVLADVAVIAVEVLIAIGVYCAACLVVLFYADFPDESPYGSVVDVVFVLTLPFVLAMAVASIIRRRNPNA